MAKNMTQKDGFLYGTHVKTDLDWCEKMLRIIFNRSKPSLFEWFHFQSRKNSNTPT